VAGSAERPFAELLSLVAARTAAPGGGSGAAWAGALGAALVEMAARFVDADEVVARAGELRSELVAAGERELTSYEPVLGAMQLAADTQGRAQRLAEALSSASESPLAIARATAEVADLGTTVAHRSKPALTGDAIAGVLLAEAACRAAVRLVEINLADREGDPRLAEATAIADRAAGAREEALGG
jgi:formiminotetrahydrofolate cyclodeaminase